MGLTNLRKSREPREPYVTKLKEVMLKKGREALKRVALPRHWLHRVGSGCMAFHAFLHRGGVFDF